MQAIGATSLLTPTAAPQNSAAFADLGSQDFLKLMLTELTNQDPLQPTDNEALLRQISSIRDIEMSTSLTDTLQKLAGQQQIGAASSVIGQFVTGVPGADGSSARASAGKMSVIILSHKIWSGPSGRDQPIMIAMNTVKISAKLQENR